MKRKEMEKLAKVFGVDVENVQRGVYAEGFFAGLKQAKLVLAIYKKTIKDHSKRIKKLEEAMK